MNWFYAKALIPIAYRGVMPFFGVLLTGWAGSLFALGTAALWIWLGCAWYHIKATGWWALAAVVVIFSVSNFLTFSRVDILELYREMGYSQAQMDLIRQQNFMTSELMMWSSVFWLAPMMGYLFWVKRFFQPSPVTR